jgi:hypothetical protein
VRFTTSCARTALMWVLGRIMAGVRRWMSAQPPPSLLKSSKLPKSNLSYRKPDLAIEPEREINPTSTEGVVRRLLEPSVDQEEEKEYERCAFPTPRIWVTPEAMQIDTSISTKRSSHGAIRTSMRRTCHSTAPICRSAKQPRQTSPSTYPSPKALSMSGSEQPRRSTLHTCRCQNG